MHNELGAMPTQTKENTMCRPVECETCHKTTWAGCGEHIDSVKEHVEPEQWCEGHAA